MRRKTQKRAISKVFKGCDFEWKFKKSPIKRPKIGGAGVFSYFINFFFFIKKAGSLSSLGSIKCLESRPNLRILLAGSEITPVSIQN
jgi:hypothetical protein